MKLWLSALALFTRARLFRLLGLLAALCALNACAGALLLAAGGGCWNAQTERACAVLFLLADLGCFLICTLPQERGGQCGLTLQRLRLSERRLFLINALVNAACFFLLWAAEAASVFALAAHTAAASGYPEGAQGLLVCFSRSDFLHTLLPLSEMALWLRNVLFVFAAGFLCAHASLALRNRKSPVLPQLFCGVLVPLFPAELGSGATIVKSALALILCVGAAGCALAAAHPGERRLEENEADSV